MECFINRKLLKTNLLMTVGLSLFACINAWSNYEPYGGKILSNVYYLKDTLKKDNPKLSFDDAKIQYEGRIEKKEGDASYLYWPGTTVKIRFKGTGIKVIMEDDKINNNKNRNFFYVIVDGKVNYNKFEINKGKQTYTLADKLDDAEHTLELFKLNSMHPGYPRGYAKLYGFELIGGGEFLPSPKEKKREMEFYGNSITCGYGIEDYEGGHGGQSLYENNYKAYGAITARYFNAEYRCIAKSGVGLIKGTTKPDMPELYDLINPSDQRTSWDFSNYSPDIVVVNLLQNDAFQIPDVSRKKVDRTYKKFISAIREKYQEAYIICVLGPMSATNTKKWPQIIKTAVKELKDDKIYTLFFPYREKPGHPLEEEHKKMAGKLIDFIKNRDSICW